jgi:ATP-dependent DNA helicase RecG
MRIPDQESVTVEFKETWTERVKPTMIGFANTLGGDIFFGVSDDGSVKGLSPSERDLIIRSATSFARHGCHPPMDALISAKVLTAARKKILVLHVEPGQNRPYSTNATDLTSKSVFVRTGAANSGANRDEIVSMIQENNPIRWEARVSPRQDLSFSQAQSLFASHGVPFGKEFWRVHGLQDENGNFTNLGMLLSDQNTAGIHLAVFDAEGKVSSISRFPGSILLQMQTVRNRLDEFNPAHVRKTNLQEREEKFPYPQHALREGLTNSLAHRDYSQPVETAVNVFPDRIEFVSYGGLPFGLTVEDAMSLGVSALRNPGLAEIFLRFHWMERIGSGFADIWRDYAKEPEQPSLTCLPKTIKLVLPKTLEPAGESRKDQLLGLFAGQTVLSRAEIENLLHLERSAVGNLLRGLVSEGLLERLGKGPGTRYRRSAAPSP